jgi:hypothetical protein
MGTRPAIAQHVGMTRLLLIAAAPRESGEPVRRFHIGRLVSEPKPLIDEQPADEK